MIAQLQRVNTIAVTIVLAIIVSWLVTAKSVDFSWFPLIAVLSSLLLIDLVVFSYLKSKNIFSFRVIFLTLSFLFHMGYSWIFLFNPTFSFDGLDFELMFDATLVLKSYLFSLAACLAVYIGMQVGDLRSNRPPQKLTERLRRWVDGLIISQRFTEKSYRNLGIAVLCITLPVRLYIDISKYALGGTGDYLSTFNVEVNGYISMLGDMTIIGIVFLLIYYRKNVTASSVVMVASVLYFIVSMGSGSRGAAMISIVILLFAYTICVRKLRTVAIISIALLGLILASYITSLGLSRTDSTVQLDVKYGTQSRFLQEFGGTQLTTILAMRLADGQVDGQYAYGETYFAALLTILPNLTADYERYIDNNNFQKQLNYPTIGGSYIAELYYNFGSFAIIMAAIVGFAISRFERMMTSFSVGQKFVLLAFSIFIARQALWWVRDTALVFPRHVVVGLIVLILVCLILKKFGFIKITNKQIRTEHA